MRLGRLVAKRGGGWVTLAEARRAFPWPELIHEGYWRNQAAQEKFGALIADGRANAVMTYLPEELEQPLPPGYAYWSRHVDSYRIEDLPCRTPEQAAACLFVLAVLLRNWDDCPVNRALVAGLPMLYDLGEIGNPNLAALPEFAAALAAPHPGHHCATYLYARGFTRDDGPHLAAALERFTSLSPAEIELLGRESRAAEECPLVVAQVLGRRETLRADCAWLLERLGGG